MVSFIHKFWKGRFATDDISIPLNLTLHAFVDKAEYGLPCACVSPDLLN